MFCRYCGEEILADSRYCSRCGKRLLGGSSRLEALARRLYLRTPYPYAGLLCFLLLLFVVFAERSRVDYGHLRLSLELVDMSIDAAMVVVGSRGLGSFRSVLLGSTSRQVVSHAHCPVLVVPAPIHAPLHAEADQHLTVTS